jgi:malonate transporter and related proteins
MPPLVLEGCVCERPRHKGLPKMSSVIDTIVPVFGLIALGFLAGRTGYVSDAATKGLPEFVFRIAMPLMLFRTIGSARFPDGPFVKVLAAFFGAVLVVWLLMSLATRMLGRSQADAASLSMAATFSNSVMLGIPIAISHFGPEAAPYIALIVLSDTALLWLVATMHIAMADGTRGTGLGGVLWPVLHRLVTNPIIVGCAAGLAWKLSGLALPMLADRMVSMIGAAAIPGALVTMGLALNSYGLAGQGAVVAIVAALKLVVKPLAAYVLGAFVLGLPPLAVAVVTLLAAMPVGSNAYLFAAAYQREEAAVSGAIALTTPLALLTLTVLLFWLPGQL